MEQIKLGRDPFARRTIRKRHHHDPKADCAWCGSEAQQWVFYADEDSPNRSYAVAGGRPFCGVGCLNSYVS